MERKKVENISPSHSSPNGLPTDSWNSPKYCPLNHLNSTKSKPSKLTFFLFLHSNWRWKQWDWYAGEKFSLLLNFCWEKLLLREKLNCEIFVERTFDEKNFDEKSFVEEKTELWDLLLRGHLMKSFCWEKGTDKMGAYDRTVLAALGIGQGWFWIIAFCKANIW